MCGFTCVIKRNEQHPFQKVVIPPDTLNHRGPDFTEEVIDGSIAIRHWRLSIVDLTSHSNQPIYDQDEIFVYNGELYDYASLGERFNINEKGDTRIFLNLLRQPSGYETIRSTPGFFAFLQYKKNTREVFGGRDCFGKKPLYYYIDSNIAVFSSEERGILPFIPSIRVNSVTLGHYLLYKNRFLGSTFFIGIRELAPGATFTFNMDSWTIKESDSWQSYYSTSLLDKLTEVNVKYATTNINPDEYRHQFELAVERRLNCDVPVQIALSGGVDSAALAVVATHSEGANNIKQAVTVQFTEGLDESARAKLTADNLGLLHQIVTFDSSSMISQMRLAIKAHGGPLEHPHSLAYMQMCQAVRKSGKVLLTGEGADELFFGYSHYDEYKNESFAFREYLKPSDEACFISSAQGKPFDFIRAEGDLKSLRNLSTSSASVSRELEIKTHLVSLLQRNDRMSMANSVEIRAPFLDPNIVCLALRDDPVILLKHRKGFVEKIVNDYIPTLPPFGKKNGFRVPFDENFDAIRKSSEGQELLTIGQDLLSNELGLAINPGSIISPRLGWIILNVGIFANEYLSK
ncbi:MAG: asparagine synthase-related protein [Spirochaetia bacterium]|nr:asparagine synthase-related protein [Spirochaetia bacterium]